MGERITWLSERRGKAAALTLAGGLSLMGCTADTDSNPDNNAADRVTCTAEGDWQPVGEEFNVEATATRLGVDDGVFRETGVFGQAACSEPIESFDVLDGDGNIVQVTDKGQNCLAYNKLNEEETSIQAVCVTSE